MTAVAAEPSAGRRLGLRRIRALDARLFQITAQAALLTVGVLARDFSLRPEQMLLTFAAGIATQAIWLRLLGIRHAGLLSAVVTCFGISLLVRADNLWVHPLLAALAISAKFTLRIRGKHVFNPANLAVILALAVVPGAWISPGQWGADLAYASLFVAFGSLVTRQARRWDISWAFLAFYLGLVALRVLILGQEWAIWQHHLESGALLLFAFFMISDPMTIPNHPRARLLFALAVALVACSWQFLLYRPNGLMWGLFLCAPLVPLLDRFMPAAKFAWRQG
ncbi:MAG: RnfABCDGE type electron transport complex subunit D [Rhodocyclaceae bacterium]